MRIERIRSCSRDLKSKTETTRCRELRLDAGDPIRCIPRIKNSRAFFDCSAARECLHAQASGLPLRVESVHKNRRHIDTARTVLEHLRLKEKSTGRGAR